MHIVGNEWSKLKALNPHFNGSQLFRVIQTLLFKTIRYTVNSIQFVDNRIFNFLLFFCVLCLGTKTNFPTTAIFVSHFQPFNSRIFLLSVPEDSSRTAETSSAGDANRQRILVLCDSLHTSSFLPVTAAVVSPSQVRRIFYPRNQVAHITFRLHGRWNCYFEILPPPTKFRGKTRITRVT